MNDTSAAIAAGSTKNKKDIYKNNNKNKNQNKNNNTYLSFRLLFTTSFMGNLAFT